MRTAVLYALLLFAPVALCAGKAPFTFDAMMRLQRIDDPQLSPDGKMIAFTVQTVDVPNKIKPVQIYTVPVDGGQPQVIAHDGNSNIRPRWMPDSKRILFVSDRSGGSQIWSMNADGSDAKPVTNLPTEADGVTVSPDGKLVLFTATCIPSARRKMQSRERLTTALAIKLNWMPKPPAR